MRLVRPDFRRALPALALLFAAAGTPAAQDDAPDAPAAKASAPPRIRYGKPRKIATLADGRVDESSGLAAGRARPGVFWTHNDSGDAARLYAFDRKGRRLAEVVLEGVHADDWEDIASFRRHGRNLLVVADVGDNNRDRLECSLYLVDEPAVGTPARPVTRTVRVLQRIRFVYEGGPCDCEAVGFDPASGRFYFVSKEGIRCGVYELDVSHGPKARSRRRGSAASRRVHRARLIGEIETSPVVAMDMSPDGRRAIILTYADALEFTRREGETWRQAFARKPRTIVMPRRRQGEAVCYGTDGRTLYLTSEHTPRRCSRCPFSKMGREPGRDFTPRRVIGWQVEPPGGPGASEYRGGAGRPGQSSRSSRSSTRSSRRSFSASSCLFRRFRSATSRRRRSFSAVSRRTSRSSSDSLMPSTRARSAGDAALEPDEEPVVTYGPSGTSTFTQPARRAAVATRMADDHRMIFCHTALPPIPGMRHQGSNFAGRVQGLWRRKRYMALKNERP